MRDGNSISKIASSISQKSPVVTTPSLNLRALIGETPVVLSHAAIGFTQESGDGKASAPTHPALAAQVGKGETLDRQAVANASVATIDRVMVELFGDPADPASIEAAVDRYPRELCNQLGIMNGLITAATADIGADMANTLKKTAGRDIFALRMINPAPVAQPEVVRTDSPAMKASTVSVAKAVQNLVNGFEVGGEANKDACAEIGTAGAALNLKDRWSDGFAKFLAVAPARANPMNVANAAADAPNLIATRDRLVAERDALTE